MRGLTRIRFLHNGPLLVDTMGERGVNMVKKEEKEPINWEVKDPKPPVVQSGHMEERKR